jgi:hypothetical protein
MPPLPHQRAYGSATWRVLGVDPVVATNIKRDSRGFVCELHILVKTKEGQPAQIARAAAVRARRPLKSATVPGDGTSRTIDQGPGPKKRGNVCVTDFDLNRDYGFQAACPAPQGAASKRTATRC